MQRYIKLNENFFRDISVKRLRSIAGGDTYTIVYLKLLLLTIGSEGRFNYCDAFSNRLAYDIGESSENVKATIKLLEDIGILVRNSALECEIKMIPVERKAK